MWVEGNALKFRGFLRIWSRMEKGGNLIPPQFENNQIWNPNIARMCQGKSINLAQPEFSPHPRPHHFEASDESGEQDQWNRTCLSMNFSCHLSSKKRWPISKLKLARNCVIWIQMSKIYEKREDVWRLRKSCYLLVRQSPDKLRSATDHKLIYYLLKTYVLPTTARDRYLSK